jgi:hypothetical protein
LAKNWQKIGKKLAKMLQKCCKNVAVFDSNRSQIMQKFDHNIGV